VCYDFLEHVNIETALEFTKFLGKEEERIVWGAALTLLRNSFNKFRETEAFEEFKVTISIRCICAAETNLFLLLEIPCSKIGYNIGRNWLETTTWRNWSISNYLFLTKVAILINRILFAGAKVIFRATLLDWACAMEYTECATYASELYEDWLTDPITNP